MDCLVLPCSQRKRDPRTLPHYVFNTAGEPVAPAWNVYDGTLSRIVRKYAPYRDLKVMFLSARFGLIRVSELIPLYDQKMTIGQITDEWINTHVTAPFPNNYQTVYACLSQLYEVTLWRGLAPYDVTPVDIKKGVRGQGYMCQRLREFCQERSAK